MSLVSFISLFTYSYPQRDLPPHSRCPSIPLLASPAPRWQFLFLERVLFRVAFFGVHVEFCIRFPFIIWKWATEWRTFPFAEDFLSNSMAEGSNISF